MDTVFKGENGFHAEADLALACDRGMATGILPIPAKVPASDRSALHVGDRCRRDTIRRFARCGDANSQAPGCSA